MKIKIFTESLFTVISKHCQTLKKAYDSKQPLKLLFAGFMNTGIKILCIRPVLVSRCVIHPARLFSCRIHTIWLGRT